MQVFIYPSINVRYNFLDIPLVYVILGYCENGPGSSQSSSPFLNSIYGGTFPLLYKYQRICNIVFPGCWGGDRVAQKVKKPLRIEMSHV